MPELDFSDRYGHRTSHWKAIAVILLSIGGAWLGWAGLHHSRPEISSTLISFSIPSERAISLRYAIERRDPDRATVCTLVAHDFDKNVVGEIDDLLPAGPSQVEKITLVPTRSAAVNVTISRCRPSSQ